LAFQYDAFLTKVYCWPGTEAEVERVYGPLPSGVVVSWPGLASALGLTMNPPPVARS